MDPLETIINEAKERFTDGVHDVEQSFGDFTLVVSRDVVHDLLSHLKGEGFDILMDIAGVDGLHLKRKERFELIYNLYSIGKDLRLRVKVFLAEDDLSLPTVTDLWQAANWAEREAYDMLGFNFVGHPNLARILCHREFEGHALRKDYPTMKGQWATSTSDLKPDLDRE